MPISNIPVVKRPAGKICGTNFANQIVDALNSDLPLIGVAADGLLAVETSIKIAIYNDSGDDFVKGAAVVLTGPCNFPDATDSDSSQSDDDKLFKYRILMKADSADSSQKALTWGVCAESIKDQTTGLCIVPPIAQCKINLTTTTDTYVDVDPTASDTTIPKGGSTGPAQIVWALGWEMTPGTAASTGEQWAVIRLGAGAKPGIIDVDVSVTGSMEAGNATTECGFVYNWTDPGGTMHMGDATVCKTHAALGPYIAAEHGTARFKSGAWQLYWVDEQPDVVPCGDPNDGSGGDS